MFSFRMKPAYSTVNIPTPSLFTKSHRSFSLRAQNYANESGKTYFCCWLHRIHQSRTLVHSANRTTAIPPTPASIEFTTLLFFLAIFIYLLKIMVCFFRWFHSFIQFSFICKKWSCLFCKKLVFWVFGFWSNWIFGKLNLKSYPVIASNRDVFCVDVDCGETHWIFGGFKRFFRNGFFAKLTFLSK